MPILNPKRLGQMLEALEEAAPSHERLLKNGFRSLMREVLVQRECEFSEDELREHLGKAVAELREAFEGVLKTRILSLLELHAEFLPTESFQPRAYLLDLTAKGPDGMPRCRAVRAPAMRAASGSALRRDLESVFERVGAEGAMAVWTAMLPAPLTALLPGKFLAFAYLQDTSGRNAALVAGPDTVRWLSLQGEQLHDLLDAMLLLSTSGAHHVHNREVTQDLVKATTFALSGPSVMLSRPLMDAETAAAAAERLWRGPSECNHILDTYLADGTHAALDDLDFFMTLTAKLLDDHAKTIRQVKADALAQAEKSAKRLKKDHERLQMAYNGLRARAGQQDLRLRQLQAELRHATAASGGASTAKQATEPAEDTSFEGRLQALFQ